MVFNATISDDQFFTSANFPPLILFLAVERADIAAAARGGVHELRIPPQDGSSAEGEIAPLGIH